MPDFKTICAEAQQETVVQLKSEIVQAQVIPKDQSSLETSHHVSHPEQNRSEISADIAYARKLYMHPEYHFRTGKNRNAKGQWFEDWLPNGIHENRPAEIFAEKLRAKLGS